MYRIKTLVPFFFFLLSVFTTTAQVNFVAGAIVKLNGDTIKGEIDYQQWAFNPKTIRFRANASESGKSYTCKDIKGFSIKENDERYQTAIVKVNNEPIDTRKMISFASIDSINRNFELDLDTVFLLTLIQGRINLFELTYDTDGKTHFFTQKDNSKLEELRYRQVKILNRDTFAIYTDETYKNQLRSMTNDCLSEVLYFSKIPYTKPEIVAIIKKFNVCSHQLSYATKVETGERYFSINTGIAQPVFSVQDYYNYIAKTSYGQILPTIGISFEQSYNRMRNKVGLGVNLNFAFYKTNFNTKDVIYNSTIDYTVNTTAVNLSLFLRYSLTAGKIQPYIKSGIGLSYLTNSNVEVVEIQNNSTAREKIAGIEINPLQFRYLIALGVKINKFYIEPRFDRSIAALGYLSKGTSSQLSLFCGYSWTLNKKNRKK
jgi:Outer membrane protein beta-barrel domain